MNALRRLLPLLAVLLLAALAPAHALAAGPTFTLTPKPGTTAYDETGSIGPFSLQTIELAGSSAETATGLAPIFYIHRVASGGTPDAAGAADALVAAWSDAMPRIADTAVVVIEVGADSACPVDVAVRTGPAYAPWVDAAWAQEIVDSSLRPQMEGGCDPYLLALGAAAELTMATISGTSETPRPNADAPPAGPPFPDPVTGQSVYDYAGVFSPETIASTEATIDEIEARTNAEIAVVTQLKPGATTSSTEQDAIALMDQWGVGRKGFDDGLVILWNLDESLKHGKIQLYGGPGFRNLVSNEDRQAIFENDMVPYLRGGDLDGAMLAAMRRLDELMTPENAARLQAARQLNAVLGLVVAPLVFLLLSGWAVVTWWRRGRDPRVAQSDSMFMPAPPAEMTAATGALILDGRTSRRALTTAMLDLASRGEIAFRQEETGFLRATKVGVEITEPDPADTRVALNRRATLGPAEKYALEQLQRIGSDGYIEPTKLLEFGKKVTEFDSRLQKHAVKLGWFARTPSSVMGRWIGLATTEIIVGFVLFILAVSIPADSLLLIAVAVGAAGVVTMVAGYAMPARTQEGAKAKVWLAAYRRTLEETMKQARSMDEVVAKSGLTWLETPDQAVVWGTALGLQDSIQQVLERSLEDVTGGQQQPGLIWLPVWYHSSSGAGWGQGGGLAPGLMSNSAIPDFGSMMSAIGTIGNAPSSSGGGGGGGFSGGGSGGGGGGAGGGF